MMNYTEFDQFILASMPHFIAVTYQHLLEATTPQERVERALHIYNLGLRALTIGLVSQYLIRDRDRVSDSYLNELLLQKFPHLTLDSWQQLLFASLRAYEGNQDIFFMPELYDFYWDTSQLPHIRRADVEQPFRRLTQIFLEIKVVRLLPQDNPGWEQLAQETINLLQQVLQNLAFISKYDLIRVLDSDERSYKVELHKGLTITVETQPLPKHIDLNPGWFYLRKNPEELLLLHPLLVFWEGETQENGLVPTDIGVYDRFIYERLQYLLTILGRTIVDEKSVTRFVTLLYDTIEEAKRKRQEVEKLTWWQLRDICSDISKHRMATVQGKYNASLYLQREKTYQAFETFLTSKEKKCFILIGKSGVGKSNFILSVGEEFQQSSDDNCCVLMYDGANLNVELSITVSISQDFNDRLKLPGRRIDNIWEEINQIDGIGERLIILYVDAINEHPKAKELLRQVNELVQKPYSWLKVICSSRPETWQTIKRGVRLAERLYYREEGAETIGVELEPFSYSEQLEPFSREELPEAFAKYQQVFNVQTEYTALRGELRELLRDPLSLWLVANTYQERAIPETLKTSELIAKYVDMLVQSERLSSEDLRLLETQLVPLMVREGHYSNTISIADIDAAGGGLYERIYSEQELRDGQRVNQSFTNLLDTEILVKQDEGREQKIGFKYERFYEYFVGRRVFELSRSRADKSAFFRDMISQVNTVSFLWGAIKNALIQETLEHGTETLLTMCFTDEQRVKEMLVAVLTEFGQDYPKEINAILEYLLPKKERLGRLKSLFALIGKVNVKSDVRTRNARKIAVEVASNLNIPWVLQTAAMQADPTIRTAAVRYTYYLWKRNQNAGFEILQLLAKNAVPNLLPNLAAFESVIGLSLVIFFENFRNEIVRKNLQTVWRGIIANILGIKKRGKRWGDWYRILIRERISLFAINFISQLERDVSGSYNYSDIEAFFQIESEKKTLYKNLVKYINPLGKYSKEKMEADFLSTIGIDSLLIETVTILALTAHIIYSPLEFLPFLKKFFFEAQKSPPPKIQSYLVINALNDALFHYPMMDEIFDFFTYALETYQKSYTNNAGIRGWIDPQYVAEVIFLGPYIYHYYQRTCSVKTDWIENRITMALTNNDLRFFELLLKCELPNYVLGIETRNSKIAFDTLGLFLNRSNPDIDKMLQSFLARLRIQYPNEVDDFLEEQEVSIDFRFQVQTYETKETVGELIGRRFFEFLRDDVIVNSTTLREQFIRMLSKVADCKNMQEWLNYASREVINLVYGEEILHQIR